jgi:hypothetical protein
MAKKQKDQAEALQTFEKNGKKYFIDESVVPKGVPFSIPGSSEEHTFNSLALNESVHDTLIRFGLAKELDESGSEE